jgi:hypothetical protein
MVYVQQAAPPGMRLLAAVLLLAAFAGCTEQDLDETAGDEPEWTLRGSFKADRENADLEDLQARVEARGGTAAILESFPEQFVASGLSADACDALRAELETLDYLADVGSCSPARAA